MAALTLDLAPWARAGHDPTVCPEAAAILPGLVVSHDSTGSGFDHDLTGSGFVTMSGRWRRRVSLHRCLRVDTRILLLEGRLPSVDWRVNSLRV
ncbi:hypothetical protein BD626DRAFT_485137 [Schizophyllum amplum]|uniref:Uncharacterized protein n=1 Tax=Schizophyllum amplum TaxID=97359 RepID=A0A550CR03_9AGAR|nr:hypothetical protein BD626DRAFT_485137 [Auriculariopsis ampla]